MASSSPPPCLLLPPFASAAASEEVNAWFLRQMRAEREATAEDPQLAHAQALVELAAAPVVHGAEAHLPREGLVHEPPFHIPANTYEERRRHSRLRGVPPYTLPLAERLAVDIYASVRRARRQSLRKFVRAFNVVALAEEEGFHLDGSVLIQQLKLRIGERACIEPLARPFTLKLTHRTEHNPRSMIVCIEVKFH